ncbi:MAG TPA: hypothetical protein VFT47_11535 [Vicinamibacterales bacterium]|nr:hypothetical protein [Vicinamibacterales bacterium]
MSVLAAFFLCESCSSPPETTQTAAKPTVMAEKPFASGGRIDVELDGGNYAVRPAADEHIRVTFSGNVGTARAELTATGAQALVRIKDTPSNNFQATIEVPNIVDLVVRLSAGNLEVAAIPGNKEIESTAGNVAIAVADPNEYSSVDGSVKAGDIQAAVFGGSRSGLLQRFTWSGKGKYTLRASLGAGNLTFKQPR